MKIDAEILPDNLEKLKEIILFQHKEIQLHEQKLQSKESVISLLRYRLQQALIHRYGQRSEKLPSNQFNLFDEAALPTNDEVTLIQEAEKEITVAAHNRKPSGRKPLPASLPREQVIHDLSESEQVCTCGHALHKIGEDISEKLEFIPAQVRVIQHIRCKYACRACEGAVKVAPLPEQPIPKSIASAGLLAHVIISKYADHLPLYRQEKILQRMGIDIPRATLCFWALRSATLMAPLVEMLIQMIREGAYTQADETPVQVLNESGKENTTKSYMWIYRGGPLDQKAIVYEYQPSRSGQAATAFLSGFKGLLQTDGYGGYNGFDSNPEVIRAACWAHVRRKFADIVKANKNAPPGKAHAAVLYIRKLYAIETHARENKFTHEQRRHYRREQAMPILTEFKSWLDSTITQVPTQSNIGRAIAYALALWPMLIIYTDHGEIEIDNNLIENAIRPFALGRKNWLFMGSEEGAHAGAIIYSLFATCKELAIEPYAYFKYILDQLPRCTSDEDRKKLLPHFVDRSVLSLAYSNTSWD